MPAYVRRSGALLIWLVAAFGAVLYFARRVPPEYSCLSFGRSILVDIASGAMIQDRRVVPIEPIVYGRTYDNPSPDRRYAVSIQAAPGGVFQFLLVPLKTPDKPIVLEDNAAGSTYFTWSPRSNGLAYGYSIGGAADSENGYLIEGQSTANIQGG